MVTFEVNVNKLKVSHMVFINALETVLKQIWLFEDMSVEREGFNHMPKYLYCLLTINAIVD